MGGIILVFVTPIESGVALVRQFLVVVEISIRKYLSVKSTSREKLWGLCAL